MGIFWKYFKNSCRWIFIQQSGPIPAIVEGGSFLLDTARESILWLRDQFNPATSETDFAGKHAESRNIRTLPGETEEQFLSRIIYALLWFRRAGKRPGMKDNFEVIGWPDTEIINCRDEDPERWAEFKLDLKAEGKTVSPENINTIIEMTNDQKPARSKLASIGLNSSLTRYDYFSGMMKSAESVSLPAWNPVVYFDDFETDGSIIGTIPPNNQLKPDEAYIGYNTTAADGIAEITGYYVAPFGGFLIDIGVKTNIRFVYEMGQFSPFSHGYYSASNTDFHICSNRSDLFVGNSGSQSIVISSDNITFKYNGWNIKNYVSVGISNNAKVTIERLSNGSLSDIHVYVNDNLKTSFIGVIAPGGTKVGLTMAATKGAQLKSMKVEIL